MSVDASKNKVQPELDDNHSGQDSSFSHHVPSDDEEPDNVIPDLEGGCS